MMHGEKQSVLILGGTRFVGLHITEAFIAGGYEITLFNRGTSNPDAFPESETFIGDRAINNYRALAGRHFDIVIDTCAYVPRFVKEALNTIDCRHYIFISTISVYADFSAPDISEHSELIATQSVQDEGVDAVSYGPQKVLCEQEAAKHDCKLTILRPGLIVGPHDPTDRFSYWLHRSSFGGTMIAPGRPDDPIQFIDARDLARFVVKIAQNETEGVFNVVSSPNEFSIGALLEDSKQCVGADVKHRWIEDVETFDLKPWVDLPAWVSPRGQTKGLATLSNQAAIAAGLEISSLWDTVASTWAQIQNEPVRSQNELKAGLKKEHENDVLQKHSN